MLLPAGQRSTAWVKRLPDVVAALNGEVTSLIGKESPKESVVYYLSDGPKRGFVREELLVVFPNTQPCVRA